MSLRHPRGGIVPDGYGLTLTVFCKDASTDKPIMAGEPLVFDASTGEYGVKRATVDVEPQLYAKESMVVSENQPMSAFIASKYARNIRVEIAGSVVVGDSVVADGTGKMKKADAANNTLVVKVDSVKNTAEVLI